MESGYLNLNELALEVELSRWVQTSSTGRFFQRLSAAGLSRMTAAPLSLAYLDQVITEDEIDLSMQRHRHGHIREDRFETRHKGPRCSADPVSDVQRQVHHIGYDTACLEFAAKHSCQLDIHD